MTAAVLHSPGDIRIENVPRPKLSSARDILIGVEACGVCGSDIGRMMVKGAHAMPLVCGHEFSGRVIDAGDDVTGLNIGDLVEQDGLARTHRERQVTQVVESGRAAQVADQVLAAIDLQEAAGSVRGEALESRIQIGRSHAQL